MSTRRFQVQHRALSAHALRTPNLLGEQNTLHASTSTSGEWGSTGPSSECPADVYDGREDARAYPCRFPSRHHTSRDVLSVKTLVSVRISVITGSHVRRHMWRAPTERCSPASPRRRRPPDMSAACGLARTDHASRVHLGNGLHTCCAVLRLASRRDGPSCCLLHAGDVFDAYSARGGTCQRSR